MTVQTPVQATLNADGVVVPLHRAIVDTVETIASALTGMQDRDFSEMPRMPDVFFTHTYNIGERRHEERKEAYILWLMTKGLQELARGVREALEEAVLYIEMFKFVGTVVSYGEALKVREEASVLRFPPLLARVNAGLTAPMTFGAEMLSLQGLRNCLEHRAGVVGDRDVEADGVLRLTLPTYALFGEDEDGAVEVHLGYVTKKETSMQLRRVLRVREFKVGERVKVTPQELQEIAHSCWLLGQDLRTKLPRPAVPVMPNC